MIIAIEGIDGAGKHTLVQALRGQLEQRTGQAVRVIAFPRYEESIHAQLAREALYGRMGDVTESVNGMAMLFALDRFGAREKLQPQAGEVVILDRYVASNAAYSVARSGDEALADWVAELEFGTLGLPHPDVQVFLDTEVDVAAARASARAQVDDTRVKDEYEKDGSLQQRTAAAYRSLAARQWGSQWIAWADTAKITGTVLEYVARAVAAD